MSAASKLRGALEFCALCYLMLSGGTVAYIYASAVLLERSTVRVDTTFFGWQEPMFILIFGLLACTAAWGVLKLRDMRSRARAGVAA